MERRESSGCENMSGIDTFVPYDIDDDLRSLDDASNDDHDKNRVHMEPLHEEDPDGIDSVLDHNISLEDKSYLM